MPLQLVLGNSGAGKSTYLYKRIIEESMDNLDKNYFVIVPEQYTMSTQKKLVNMHPKKGILNIDVLSFERLAYKVFEEVGYDQLDVLDDTGKNLIVRRVLEQNKSSLQYFGSNLNNTGFVSEMKSVISEMLQYNVKLDIFNELTNNVADNPALKLKLKDVELIYKSFMEFIDKNYVTKEEILDKLCEKIENSNIIKNSVLVLDGFTGFTPVQYNLISILLKLCQKIYISFTVDAKEKNNVFLGMEDLFFMGKDSILRLHKICDAEHVQVLDPIVIKNSDKSRFNNSEELLYLEENLLRNSSARYTKKTENMLLYEAPVAKDEINFVVSEIIKLTRLKNYKYKDIAIVTADMENYGKLTANILKQNDIPHFIDYKRHVTDNPLVTTIMGALSVIEDNYSYNSVMGYLRAGLTGISREDIDFLDNYIVALGIKGNNKWHNPWVKKFRGSVNESDLEHLNDIRTEIISKLDPLETQFKDKNVNVAQMTGALYEFMVSLDLEEKISKLSDSEYTGDEYEQVYKRVIETLDKIYMLLGEEHVSRREYSRIVASGFDEIKIGLIPQTNDCVVIGDMERTRLDDIKVMFFVGINDGNVPKRMENRSVLSELDRESIEEKGVSLSPSSREKAFVQRFYLYLIMTKPSERLYLSYSIKNSAGAPLMASYIIRIIKKMFPSLTVISGETAYVQSGLISLPKADINYHEIQFDEISSDVIKNLTGGSLKGSVTSLEQFAACQLKYFFQYNLKLQEREEYEFSSMNFGSVVHAAIKEVCDELKKNKESFYLLSNERREELVANSMNAVTKAYKESMLGDNARNAFIIKRMSDYVNRTIWAMKEQYKEGEFVPFAFEHKFNMGLGDNDSHLMNGVIDRIDICEKDDKVYVRIVDYKTSNKEFKLINNYYGLDIQLIVYMEAAKKLIQKNFPQKEVIPAGVYYYHVDNPLVGEADGTEEGIDSLIFSELALTGKSNADSGYDVRKNSFNTEKFNKLENYIDIRSIHSINQVLDGKIKRNPYLDGNYTSCSRCPYGAVCGFSLDMPGCNFRRIKKFDDEVLWKNIEEGVDENGDKMDR